ncbi:MAG: ABC transporter ATP-binding protein [Clostridiales bacterium]|nr:ABC transporter ATP-binding protein [Clostridiales bacterium]
MLRIEKLEKMFGNYHVLDGLDMEIADGSLYGFVGPNGAGKTTTIRIVAGLLAPDGGRVEIDGIDAWKSPRQTKERIGYVPDHFGVYDNLKVSEYMEFFASCYGIEGYRARRRAEILLDQVGLGDKKDAFVDGLSRGMKQRLSLARALIHDPAFLIMDEPTAGLDPRTRLEFRDMMWDLHEDGKTILISSHQLADLAELCTDIGMIDEGKMVLKGNVSEITEQIYTSKPLIITVQENRETAMQILKEMSAIRTITVKGADIMVNFAGDGDQECELLKRLIDAGVKIRGFMREPGSLEPVFMQITNHEEERVVLSYEGESDL